MRFLQILSPQAKELELIYQQVPDLINRNYNDQLQVLARLGLEAEVLFAPFLAQQGHHVLLTLANCEHTQIQWAIERNIHPTWDVLPKILRAQVQQEHPEVILLVNPQLALLQQVLAIRPERTKLALWQDSMDALDAMDLSAVDLLLTPASPDLEKQAALDQTRRASLLPAANPVMPQVVKEVQRSGMISAQKVDLSQADHLQTLEALAACPEFNLAVFPAGAAPKEISSELQAAVQEKARLITQYQINHASAIALYLPQAGIPWQADRRWLRAAQCGAVILAPAGSGLETIFTPGKSLLTFVNASDCREQCRALLQDPSRWQTIGNAAASLIQAHHSLPQRCRELSQILHGDP